MGTTAMSYKKQVLLTLREYLGSPPIFDGICVAQLFNFLCCALYGDLSRTFFTGNTSFLNTILTEVNIFHAIKMLLYMNDNKH
jgi:hypothetical protein